VYSVDDMIFHSSLSDLSSGRYPRWKIGHFDKLHTFKTLPIGAKAETSMTGPEGYVVG
jgi:hypothetical protein